MRVLITGASGQDGRILTQILCSRHEVYLQHRKVFDRYSKSGVNLIDCDIGDTDKLLRYVVQNDIECIINTVALSSVKELWKFSKEYNRVNFLSVQKLLDALVKINFSGKFFQFGSTDMFGQKYIENIYTNMKPWSPYGESKAKAHQAVISARESGLAAFNLVLTNHDSILREPNYVMKKIALDFAEQMRESKEIKIYLQNPDIRRDWADAYDICEAISIVIQSSRPADSILATGVSMSIREVIQGTARHLGVSAEIYRESGPLRVRDFPSVAVDKNLLLPYSIWSPKCVGHQTLLKMVQELVG